MRVGGRDIATAGLRTPAWNRSLSVTVTGGWGGGDGGGGGGGRGGGGDGGGGGGGGGGRKRGGGTEHQQAWGLLHGTGFAASPLLGGVRSEGGGGGERRMIFDSTPSITRPGWDSYVITAVLTC